MQLIRRRVEVKERAIQRSSARISEEHVYKDSTCDVLRAYHIKLYEALHAEAPAQAVDPRSSATVLQLSDQLQDDA